MASRKDFLARVRHEMVKMKEGGASVGVPGAPEASGTGPAPARAAGETETLLARFRAEAERLGVGVHRAGTIEEAGEIVLRLATAREVRRVAAWERRALGAAAAVATRLAAAGLAVTEVPAAAASGDARQELQQALAAAELGLTAADLAIAETGTLVLASGPGRGRGVSLLPAYHVAVFGRAQLVPGLTDAGAELEARHRAAPVGAGANVVFITGPSRTADIELTLTRGVHGPKEVHAVFVDAL